MRVGQRWGADQGGVGDSDKKADPEKGKPEWWVLKRPVCSISTAKGVER